MGLPKFKPHTRGLFSAYDRHCRLGSNLSLISYIELGNCDLLRSTLSHSISCFRKKSSVLRPNSKQIKMPKEPFLNTLDYITLHSTAMVSCFSNSDLTSRVFNLTRETHCVSFKQAKRSGCLWFKMRSMFSEKVNLVQNPTTRVWKWFTNWLEGRPRNRIRARMLATFAGKLTILPCQC